VLLYVLYITRIMHSQDSLTHPMQVCVFLPMANTFTASYQLTLTSQDFI